MKITCSNTKQFYDTIEELVKKGLKFNADANKLIIELTGGY